jgi:iron(III) transport system substrate-binding protein
MTDVSPSKPSRFRLFFVTGLWTFLGLGLVAGCLNRSEHEVVLFVALDREFSQPILSDLEQEMGIKVRAKFDQESNKTVGLVTGIIQSKQHPQADIFWNNEILHTLRLQELGLLETYRSPQAEHFPDQFLSRENQWHGFAARARVLIVNTDLLPDPQQRPTSIYDLADPKWKGRCAMARPLFGTTATHAAVLFAELGDEKAKKFLTDVAHNAAIEGGNKQVAIKVARGEYAFGLTDTDDAIIELEQANPVAIVFPDQAIGQLGTLLIPNTLAIIKNGPNPERAKKLVDRLLQPDVEARLAAGSSAQIPLSQIVEAKSRVQPHDCNLKIMQADFRAAADAWDEAALFLTATFPAGGK